MSYILFFFFKQKTAYEMRISDWSSDVCSSDLEDRGRQDRLAEESRDDADDDHGADHDDAARAFLSGYRHVFQRGRQLVDVAGALIGAATAYRDRTDMARWYIIHAYSGFENKVRDSVLDEAERMGLSKCVEAVEVPVEIGRAQA